MWENIPPGIPFNSHNLPGKMGLLTPVTQTVTCSFVDEAFTECFLGAEAVLAVEDTAVCSGSHYCQRTVEQRPWEGRGCCIFIPFSTLNNRMK